MEDVTIQNLYSKIEKLNTEMKILRDETAQNFVLARLERLCYELKCSIVVADLKTPEVQVFDRYLQQLSNSCDIIYVTYLLRQCWRYANPQALVDAPLKTLPQEELLHMALSKYSDNGSECSADTFNEECHSLLVKRAAKKCDLSFHNEVLKKINSTLVEVGKKHSISISPDFLSYRAIISPLSQAQLYAVFDVLVSEGCTRSQDKKSFLASFNSSIQARQSQVCWLATNPKNRTTNYAKLFVLFQVLQVELSESAKSVIAETFVAPDGSALNASSIKAREESHELISFRQSLEEAIL